jgi:hypothetical protein
MAKQVLYVGYSAIQLANCAVTSHSTFFLALGKEARVLEKTASFVIIWIHFLVV